MKVWIKTNKQANKLCGFKQQLSSQSFCGLGVWAGLAGFLLHRLQSGYQMGLWSSQASNGKRFASRLTHMVLAGFRFSPAVGWRPSLVICHMGLSNMTVYFIKAYKLRRPQRKSSEMEVSLL